MYRRRSVLIILMLSISLCQCNQIKPVEETFDRNFDLKNATVTLNQNTEQQAKGIIVLFRDTTPGTGLRNVLLAPASAFENQQSKFNLAFTNLELPTAPEWDVRKVETVYQEVYEIKYSHDYPIAAIDLTAAGNKKKLHSSFSNLHTIELYDIKNTEQVQKDLIQFLGIETNDLENTIKHIQELIYEAVPLQR